MMCSGLIACNELEARDQAYAGRDALKACDFHHAYLHFSDAYPSLKERKSVSLGYAFSNLLDILNSESFSGILKRLGVSSTIEDYCLQQINQTNPDDTEDDTDRCATGGKSIRSMKWPYPCDDFEHCDYIAYIDKSLEWHEIIETVSDNRWELLRSSYIITDVANHMKEPYVIEDVLGVKRLTIQRSDLYLFSAMVKLLVFASDVAAVYENRFSVSESLDDRNCRNQMDILNRYIGIAAELPDVSDSIIVFTDMMADIENAFVNARLLRDEYDNDTSQKCGNSVSIFNWVEVPYGVMDNIISVASAFKQDPVVISDVFSPDLRIDLSGLLQHLPVRTSEEPVVSCGDNGLEAAYGIYIKYFNDYVNPPLFEPDTEHFDLHHDINYRLSSGWRKWTVLDLF